MTIIGKAMEEQRRIARLGLGSVVRRRDREERGVIVWARGHGDFRAQPMIDGYPFAIAKSGTAGIYTCTGGRDWFEVPSSEQTTQERIRSAMASWGLRGQRDDVDDPLDCETFPYALVAALLPPDRLKVFEEWDARSFGELVTEVGAYIHELGERDTS